MKARLRARFARGLRLAANLVLVAALIITSTAIPANAQSISLVRDAETERLLRDMTDPIFRAAGLDPAAVDIYLVNDQTPNAFVAIGQKMFFHTGIITSAELPNELIGVIAHETGHITGGHLARSSEAFSELMRPSLLAAAIGLAAIAAGAPQVGAAVFAGSQHVATRAAYAFSRSQEASADQAAVYFLDKTGQSGEGLLTFFDRFRDMQVMSSRAPNPYVQTHPLSSERVAALTRTIESSPNFSKKDDPAEIARLNLVRAKLFGFIERTDAVLRRYPVSDVGQPARYARSVAYYRQGRLEEALAEVDHLMADDPANPYFVELKGQILFESGLIEVSVEPYAKAVGMAPDEPLIRASYGQALLAKAERTHNPALIEKSIEQLRIALNDEEDLGIAWRTLAEAYSRQGNEGMAQLSTAELYFRGGNLPQAANFASRSLDKLERGTTPYLRASDIVYLAQTGQEDTAGSRRN